MNTQIQTNLISLGASSGLVNVTDGLTDTLLTLCKTYIPGLPNRYKGLQPIESQGVSIPCVMLQPVSTAPAMNTTAKFQKFYLFDFWFAVGDGTVAATVVRATDAGEIFMKLFSNNALNDRTTATPTNKFKTNGSLWVDSEMTRVEYSVPFIMEKPNYPKYVALGNFQLKLQTVNLV